MGRRPKPAELAEAQGNPGKRKNTTVATTDLPTASAEPPKYLKGRQARDIYKRLAPALIRLKFLRSTDVEPFARYCKHLADWWRLTGELDRDGMTYETESKFMKGKLRRVDPRFMARDRIERQIEGLEDRFGMNARARQQIMMGLASQLALPLGGGKTDRPGEAPTPKASPVGILRGTDAIN